MRAPAVSGYFYKKERAKLEKEIEDYLLQAKKEVKPKKCYGGIVPHAGHVYSGLTAAYTYATIEELRSAHTIVIIGPNHSGYGSMVSVSLDSWDTPLGVIENDKELGAAIQRHANFIDFDEASHLYEHSIEVQLPFIRLLNNRAKITPICMLSQDWDTSKDVSKALVAAVKETLRDVVVIASSDFTHYESAKSAEKKDKSALEFITRLDATGFQKAVEDNNWSICGHGPIAALMEYAKGMGAKKGEIVRYTSSAETTGNFDDVVGYASVVFPR